MPSEQQPKTKSKPKSKPLVLDSKNSGMSNFPSSAESSYKELTEFINKYYDKGYLYYGSIVRAIGGEKREYYIFYPM
jgi:hypothetical protein